MSYRVSYRNGQYRLGRHHKDTVYWQSGEHPSDADQRVAIFMHPFGDSAAEYVEIMNGILHTEPER